LHDAFILILFSTFSDVDQVHDMMDDIAEQQDVAKEISDAISNPVPFGQDVDEVRCCLCAVMSVKPVIF